MQSQRINYLLEQYISGRISDQEWKELFDVLQNIDNEGDVKGWIAQSLLGSIPSSLDLPLKSDTSAPSEVPDTPLPISDMASLETADTAAVSSDTSDTAGTAVSAAELRERAPVLLNAVLSIDKTGDRATGIVMEGTSGGIVTPIRRHWWKWSAAAIFLLTVTAGGIWYYSGRHMSNKSVAGNSRPAAGGIVPGSNKAILTLAGGQQIVLTGAQNGVLSQQGNIKVIKLDSGSLSYRSDKDGTGGRGNSASAGGAPAYNTITTPRGGQYQIVLSDGTKVWLNAASSLKFPTVFAKGKREVELTGEAYFEVAADKLRPFDVRVGAASIDVLGTHFDIKAYDDEKAIRTTLLEGSVKMNGGSRSALLKPGEQAAFEPGAGNILTREVNVRAAVAWKDGYYYFDRTDIGDIMRQIARWYDVQIVYQGPVPTDEIVGKIPRTANVTEVLHIMELIGIHFKIEGRKIIVLS